MVRVHLLDLRPFEQHVEGDVRALRLLENQIQQLRGRTVCGLDLVDIGFDQRLQPICQGSDQVLLVGQVVKVVHRAVDINLGDQKIFENVYAMFFQKCIHTLVDGDCVKIFLQDLEVALAVRLLNQRNQLLVNLIQNCKCLRCAVETQQEEHQFENFLCSRSTQ